MLPLIPVVHRLDLRGRPVAAGRRVRLVLALVCGIRALADWPAAFRAQRVLVGLERQHLVLLGIRPLRLSRIARHPPAKLAVRDAERPSYFDLPAEPWIALNAVGEKGISLVPPFSSLMATWKNPY